MKTIRILSIFIISFVFISSSEKSNNYDAPTDQIIAELIQNKMKQMKIPGITAGILKHNRVIHSFSYGYANVELAVPTSFDTIFQSGSVGKQFTAAAVMILVERNLIKVDDPIQFYFNDTPKTWEKITIRHLLTHTSGLAGYPRNFNYRIDFTEQEIYEYIKTLPLLFNPGDNWFYSNLGYVLLGILVNRVTGQFYGDFLDENIFRPFNMKTAQVINEADIIPNRASGYVLINGELKNQPWVSATLNTMADGALYLSFNDMIQWDGALHRRELFKSEQTYETIWSPVILNNGTIHPYGFGWRISKTKNGLKIVQHGGSWQGFQAMFIRVLKANITVVLFANLNSGPVFRIGLEILEAFDPMLAEETIL